MEIFADTTGVSTVPRKLRIVAKREQDGGHTSVNSYRSKMYVHNSSKLALDGQRWRKGVASPCEEKRRWEHDENRSVLESKEGPTN